MIDELLYTLQVIVTIITLVFGFLGALWKILAQSNEASKSQREHDQNILDRLTTVVENLWGMKRG